VPGCQPFRDPLYIVLNTTVDEHLEHFASVVALLAGQ
jgi:hypothetical protein